MISPIYETDKILFPVGYRQGKSKKTINKMVSRRQDLSTRKEDKRGKRNWKKKPKPTPPENWNYSDENKQIIDSLTRQYKPQLSNYQLIEKFLDISSKFEKDDIKYLGWRLGYYPRKETHYFEFLEKYFDLNFKPSTKVVGGNPAQKNNSVS